MSIISCPSCNLLAFIACAIRHFFHPSPATLSCAYKLRNETLAPNVQLNFVQIIIYMTYSSETLILYQDWSYFHQG